MHFGASQKQIPFQTGGFYYKNYDNEIKFESIYLMSDCLIYDAAAVWALLSPVFDRIQEIPEVEIIHIQSDGPTTPYTKIKLIFYYLIIFVKIFILKALYGIILPLDITKM